ncbi:hypothetical protein G6K98_00080 [Agrobacterium rhizogenes]|nr:hypothetical protein [Rhizobium rhizogenes]NTH55896.1 hypothetical protein [Rhizobium rhizogenes]NTH87526.1 hypothetical protein [Rhizobium rhizogenes]
MEKQFSVCGRDYVLYQEHGQKMYVNGRSCCEWVLREQTANGREWAGRWHMPAWKTGKKVVDHIKEQLVADSRAQPW